MTVATPAATSAAPPQPLVTPTPRTRPEERAAAPPIIQVYRVSKRFGPVTAVDGVSFDIRRGEFFSLLGPSGCGKTTLLRMLAGFEQPSAGDIRIDGQSMLGVPAYDRPTNMVFQSYAIFPHLTVAENIAYGLRSRRVPRARQAEMVDEALHMIQMPGYGGRAAHQLSGGQRQRVALARALVCQPKVLLLDEPLGALDKKLREEMQIELRMLQRRVGVTFVFVTHDQEEALTLSDRIAVMSQGRTLQIASATELYEAPNCRQVASFIGSMNLFEGIMRDVAGAVAVVETGRLGLMRATWSGTLPAEGAAVAVAVRPEKMRLAWTQPATDAGQQVLRGVISAEAYFGDRSHYYVTVEGLERPLAVANQNSDRSLDDSETIGRAVWLTWPVEAAVLLST